jgi:hypothetical protein
MNKENTELRQGESREKFWTELTIEEKLERSRQIIKTLSNHLAQAQSDVHHLREGLRQHTHSEKGIVVPWNEYDNRSNALGVAAIRGGEDYF